MVNRRSPAPAGATASPAPRADPRIAERWPERRSGGYLFASEKLSSPGVRLLRPLLWIVRRLPFIWARTR